LEAPEPDIVELFLPLDDWGGVLAGSEHEKVAESALEAIRAGRIKRK
jgi:hypothetical protein